MLALTYPDGARVHRCDYLPENPSISSFNFKPQPSNIGIERLSSINELNRVNSTSLGSSVYAARFKRRLRREETRRKNESANIPAISSQETSNPLFYIHENCYTLGGGTTYNGYDKRCDKSTDERAEDKVKESCEYRASSQSTNKLHYQHQHHRPHHEVRHRFEVFQFNERTRTSNDSYTRRRELPGRESWPGGSHPKDRRFLQLVLILVLLVIGSNRHCGPFRSRVNRTAFGVFAFGSVAVGKINCAPVDIITDTGVRSERSANLSHITGASRKIQMYIKNRHLQILPDGTVNGSNDDTSDFTILQRTSVSRGQLRIQGVATCLYLCMDSCGLLYGSREYTEDCVFNETLEQHNYNTYSSAHWSTPRKTLYLGISGRGQPRRVQAKGHNLGRLSAYARVLTQVVAQDRVEGLQRRMLGAKHNVRHHHGSQQSICPAPTPQEKDGRDKFRCRKRKKRKKRRRKCRAGEIPGPQCDVREPGGSAGGGAAVETQSKRSCEGAAVDEACRREALDAPAKKRKSRIEEMEEIEKPEMDVDADEETTSDKKTRRSNVSHRKKIKKPPVSGGKKSASGNKKKKNGQNAPINSKNSKNSAKMMRKKGANHHSGRFVRTTNSRLSSSSFAMTSPLSWYPVSTNPTPVDKSSFVSESHNSMMNSDPFTDHPKSLSSSSSSVSAVSLAATGLASTLTLTVAAGAEVFAEARNAGVESSTDNSSIFISADFDEFADVKEFEDDEDERDDDEDERDESRNDFGRMFGSTKTETDTQRLAM